jgi:hypothetical protein
MKWALASLMLAAGVATADAQPAESGWFDLPVPGGERTLAAIGVGPADRAHTLALAARIAGGDDSRQAPTSHRLADVLRAPAVPSLGASEDDDPLSIPAPLNAEVWRELLVVQPGEDLFLRLLGDRAATLVVAGFTSTDTSIRQLALGDSAFVRRIYREAPGAFAVVARSLRIEEGRVAVPGGAGADKIWEALAGAPPSRPQAFITALVKKDAGRLAWYFDAIASLDPLRLHAVWPEASERDRLANARALYASFRRVELRWQLEQQPFRRAAADPWMVLAFSDVRDGVVTGPNWQWLWDALYTSAVLDRAAVTRLDRRQAPPVSLTWVAQTIAAAPARERKEQFEMFRLAQRVFPTAQESDAIDLAIALSGYRRHRALLLALERMQIVTPATWAALVEAARHVDRAIGDRAEALASFQGAIALVGRMWHVGTLDTPAAERLVRSLAGAVHANDRVSRSVGRWIRDTLAPVLEPASLLDALAGPTTHDPRPIEWEGLEYQLDFAAAERARLDRILELTNAPSLDAAIAANNAASIAVALKALVYASALGDPEGAVTLGPDIAARHDFGIGLPAVLQAVTPWALPVEMQIEGKPWHVRGSIIGLDLGLARLSIRHLAGDQMPNAPTMTMNDYGTLAQTTVAMRPADFTDADRDAIVAAIARGRRRLADAGTDLAQLDALARESRLSPSARQLLPWVVAREPEAIAQFFSLRDLLWLGTPSLPAERLDRWGMLGHPYDGRLTPVMPHARAWEEFAGRPETGMMSAQVPDLTLRLAEETARLHLPAALVPPMLSYAVQDYWYDVRARFADDWPAMIRQAAALSSERAEDYVAALAGTGVLRLRGGAQ